MGPLDNIDDLLKVLFFVVIIGGWIVKLIFRNLIKPAMKRQAGQGGPPAKGLREFLDEIRREEAGGDAPARQAAPVDPAEELVWEEVDEVEAPRPAAQQGERSAFEEKRARWKQETEGRRAERKRQRQERARHGQEEVEAERAAAAGEQQPQDERHIGSGLDDRRLQSRLADRQLGRPARRKVRSGSRARTREITGALQGLTVKDLILAEVILGKPRSKKRHIRDV